MGFDYPRSSGYQVGTDFDGSTLHTANFTGGQFNVLFTQGTLARRRFYSCGDQRCRRCGDGQTTFVDDPHRAPFNRHLPELYSIELRVQSPHVTNGTIGCHYTPGLPGFPGSWSCGERWDHDNDPNTLMVSRVDQAYYEGRVDAAGLAFLDHSATEIDPTFESTPAPGGAIYSPFWPDGSVYDRGVVEGSNNPPTSLTPGFAYLENPNPTWPVPDAQGSTFGRALWRLDQIPWEVGVTFIHHNHDHGQSGALLGSMNGIVRGYLLSRRTQTIATVSAGPGPAGFRRRGQIVGQGGNPLQIG